MLWGGVKTTPERSVPSFVYQSSGRYWVRRVEWSIPNFASYQYVIYHNLVAKEFTWRPTFASPGLPSTRQTVFENTIRKLILVWMALGCPFVLRADAWCFWSVSGMRDNLSSTKIKNNEIFFSWLRSSPHKRLSSVCRTEYLFTSMQTCLSVCPQGLHFRTLCSGRYIRSLQMILVRRIWPLRTLYTDTYHTTRQI